MPLSEEEQRILQEMEQKLYERDRPFVGRVRSAHPFAHRSLRSAIAIFVAGFAVVILSFRSSLLLATFGFLVMLLASLMVGRGWRNAELGRADKTIADRRKGHPLAGEFASMSRRLRSRFHPQR